MRKQLHFDNSELVIEILVQVSEGIQQAGSIEQNSYQLKDLTVQSAPVS